MAHPRRALRIATGAMVVVWLPAILVWGPLPHALTYDDAWYYFEIGRHIADGAGSTFDGINPTNGYHPLWMLVCAAAFVVGLDELAAVRALLVVQLLAWAAALVLLGDALVERGWWRISERAGGRPAARRCNIVLAGLWFAFAANPYVLKTFVNGMETGLVALTAAGLLALALRTGGDPLRRPVVASILLVLAFLARTDFLLIAAPLLLWTALVRRRVDRRLLAVGATLGVVFVAYLASNVGLVGHPLQISGVTKRVDPDAGGVVTMLLLTGVGAAVLWLGLRVRRAGNLARYRLPRAAKWVADTAWYAAGGALILAYDWGLTAEVYLWHYAPHLLWGAMLFVAVAADLLEGVVLEGAADDRRAAARPWIVGGVLLVPVVAGAAWQIPRFTDAELYGLQTGDRAAGEWITANLPADAVVGSYDAGVLGYFSEQPVVNLDGLVNSFEWRDARAAGVAATGAFLDDAGVRYLANHGDVVDGQDPGLADAADGLWGPGTGERLVLRHRLDYVFAGTAGGGSGRRPYGTFVYELPPPG